MSGMLVTAAVGGAGVGAALLWRYFRKFGPAPLRSELVKQGVATEYVFTQSAVTIMKRFLADSYKAMGHFSAGDIVLQSELDLCIQNTPGGLDMLLTTGFVARKDAAFIKHESMLDPNLDQWCETGHEEPLLPLWPSIDPHHHIFDNKMEPGQPLPPPLVHSFSKRCPVVLAYPYEQLARDLAGNNVAATVFIECGHRYEPLKMMENPLASLEETKAIQAIADQSAAPMAIVPHMDLSKGRESVEKVVRAHKEAGKNLVGVRHALAWLKDVPLFSKIMDGQPEFVSRGEGFREGMQVLAENDLSYDCWLFHANLPELIELAHACPNTRIICDHVGQPLGQPLAGFSRETSMPEWKRCIKELSTCENVTVKLSGLSTSLVGFGFELCDAPPTSVEMAAAYEPYFQFVMECFGPKRCFFASNFPVDKASGSFTTHWNAFKILSKKLLPNDEPAQRALFYDNAVRTYRLDQPPFNLPSTSAEAEGCGLATY